MDFEIITQTVCWYLCMAESLHYLPDWKKRYNIAFLPKIHHLYSGHLKIAGYKRLSHKKRLFVISEWVDDEWIVLYNESISFMWKKWNFDGWLFKKYAVKIQNSSDGFEFIENELPYIRIIWDFDEIYFFRIWKNETIKNIYKFIAAISKLWNVIFLSDLHSWFPLTECEKADEEAVSDADKCDIFMLNLFLWFALLKDSKLRVVWYGNTAYLNWNKKDTTGYCTILV